MNGLAEARRGYCIALPIEELPAAVMSVDWAQVPAQPDIDIADNRALEENLVPHYYFHPGVPSTVLWETITYSANNNKSLTLWSSPSEKLKQKSGPGFNQFQKKGQNFAYRKGKI